MADIVIHGRGMSVGAIVDIELFVNIELTPALNTIGEQLARPALPADASVHSAISRISKTIPFLHSGAPSDSHQSDRESVVSSGMAALGPLLLEGLAAAFALL